MKKYKTIQIDDVEYKLVPVDQKEYLTIEELSQRVPYTVHTLYKLKKEMTEEEHYKRLKGKILFDAVNVVSFLLNRKKGEHTNESKQGQCIQEKRQSISLSEFIG